MSGRGGWLLTLAVAVVIGLAMAGGPRVISGPASAASGSGSGSGSGSRSDTSRPASAASGPRSDSSRPASASTSPASAGSDPVPQSNLLANGCFSDGASGWQSWQGTVSVVAAADAPCGSHVALVSYGGSGGSYTLDTVPGAVVSSATRGMRYTASAWVKGTPTTVGQIVEIAIREFRGGSEIARAISAPVVLSRSYQPLSVSYTARRAGDQINLFLLRPYEMVALGDSFYVGDVALSTVPETNLMTDPSFESGVSGWGGWHATLAAIPVLGAPDGQRVAQVTSTSTDGYTIDADDPAPVRRCTAGMSYTASAWVRASASSAGRAVVIGIREWSGRKILSSATSASLILTSGAWRHLQVAYTARRSGDLIDMYVARVAPTDVGESFQIDDFTISDVPAGNLLPNPSFESGLYGWTAHHARLERLAATDAPDAGHVVRVASTRAGEYAIDALPAVAHAFGAGGPAAGARDARLWPEASYTASAWVKGSPSSAGRPITLVIREWHDGRVIDRARSRPVRLSGGEYRQVSVGLDPRYGGDMLDLYLERAHATAGESFYADDITLTERTLTPARECPQAFGSFRAGNWPPACWRPYGGGSIFNTPLPARPRLAGNSSAIVNFMAARGWTFPSDSDGNFAISSAGDIPVYWPQRGDPKVKITCTGRDGGVCRPPFAYGRAHAIRLPAGAQPEAGSDGHMAVVDQAGGWEYDLWQARWTGASTLSASSACRIPIGAGSGSGLGGCARAVPIGLLGGLIRAPELASGRIDHALVIAVPCTAAGVNRAFPSHVFPAGSANGYSCPVSDGGKGPPLGALLQLTWGPRQIAASGAPAWQRAIMNAMHTYGVYVVDTAGATRQINFGKEADQSYTSLAGFGWGPLCHGLDLICEGELGAVLAAAGGSFSEPGNDWLLTGVPLPIVSNYGRPDARANFRVIAPCVAERSCQR